MDHQKLLASQLANVPPEPTQDLSHKVYIVTGANSGLGLEAAKWLVRLNAAKVIITSRSMPKGEAAKAEIETSTGRTGVLELYELDLSSYESVKQFASKIEAEQPRIDGLLNNAGGLNTNFELLEGTESTLTINVVSTFLLTILLLPHLRRSAEKYKTSSNVSFVGSGTAITCQFNEHSAPHIFDTLSDREKANMSERYPLSKLIMLALCFELAERMRPSSPSPALIVNTLNPGLCHSNLTTKISDPAAAAAIEELKAKFARTAEEGGRTLVHGITAGSETHGKLLNNCQISEDVVPAFLRSSTGEKTQKQLWEELSAKLEAAQPGIMANV